VRELRKGKLGYALLIPAFFLVLLAVFYPMVYSFVLSFCEFDLGTDSTRFVGLSNYVEIISADYFLPAIQRTIQFAVMSLAGTIAISLGMALVLNENIRGRFLARVLLLVPWAIPGTVNGLMWKWIFNANFGGLNGILTQLHVIPSYVNWLSLPATAMLAVVFANVWKEVPFSTLILLAGIQSIPLELYDAAHIDGANTWNRFVKITLPLLKNSILIVLILNTMINLLAFDIIYVLTGGGPADYTAVLNWWTYTISFRMFNFGLGSALAYTLGAINLVVAIAYFKSLYRRIEF